jgi:hypothetical protein
MLSSPTSVGLRYGHPGVPPAAFRGGEALPGGLPVAPQQGGPASPLDNRVPCSEEQADANPRWGRNVTGCPSPTPFGLGLGPPNPPLTNIAAQETLGFRRRGFSPLQRYSYRHSHSSPLHRGFPHGFAAATTLPYQDPHSVCAVGAYRGKTLRGFGGRLETREFSAQGNSPGELIRTPWMIGCFRANIPGVFAAPPPLVHSARTWGP